MLVYSYCAISFEVTASSRYEILKKLAASIQNADAQAVWAPIVHSKSTEAQHPGYFSYRPVAAVRHASGDGSFAASRVIPHDQLLDKPTM